jgi:hypothetical protein
MSGGTGGMDLRIPMGLMFLIVGGITTVYGLATNGDPMYADHSLGININLIWGIVLVLFSLAMLGLAWGAARKRKH